MNGERPTRKKIRLPQHDYSKPGAYFVTICTGDRAKILWEENPDCTHVQWHAVGANCVRPQNLPLSIIGYVMMSELEVWNKTYPAVTLSSYVIMPDHLHVMIEIHADENGRPQVAPTVSRMVKQFKGRVTKAIGRSIWQKSFVEHVVRDQEDYARRMQYICDNPIRRRFANT